VTGSIGLLGTKPSYELMDGCDTLLMVGTSFPYSEWLPEEGAARGVQIDIDAKMIGLRFPTEVNLLGDARETLRELIGQIERKEDRSWREKICSEVERWWDIQREVAMIDANPVNPQRVFYELNQRVPDNVVLTADSGSATNWWARHLRMRDGMRAALSGTLATMCPAVPYAVAAKEVFPDRPVIASLGDGAMQMLGINALIDIANYQERWSNKQMIVCILNNQDLNQVTWEQRVMGGSPKVETSQVLPDFDYAGYAELLGLKGIKVDDPDRVGDAWDEALAHDGPVVLEAITDPEVPPLPPHIQLDQAVGMAKTLAQGDPAALEMIRQSFKGKLKEFTTR
jgi:pyruvate dehydrogenase (quinone)